MATSLGGQQVIRTRELVQCPVPDTFSHIRPRSLDDTLQNSQHLLHSHESLPAELPARLSLKSPSLLSSFGLIPGHEIINVTARLEGVERANNHCVFRILVDTGREEFTLQKRYSEFRDLREHLLMDDNKRSGSECRNGACLQLAQQLRKIDFPRRQFKLKLYGDEDLQVAKKRQAQLQHFLDVVLAVYRTAPKRQVRCCVNSQCHAIKTVRSFIRIQDASRAQVADWKATSYESRGKDVISGTP
ncbi:hypothetical protein PHYPSEUDO_012904 [Phytophthora pseudosyringae]|uniref:PX domain-containing protein n=1 Tax=Phytophthora pseudosyringae TaxID=221518 RepID=A0A8T1W4P8_9STRA|nr:hypothetical protein PHYPSEUDO_012904 [Phytophthora pseudosyringae]